MRPLVDVGDYVWVEQVVWAALRSGDVITKWQNGDLLTHRLLRVDGHGCVTKGDNCAAIDPPITYAFIMGRVTAVERQGKRIDLHCRRWRVAGGAVAWLSQAAMFKLWCPRIIHTLVHAAIYMLVMFTIQWEKQDVQA